MQFEFERKGRCFAILRKVKPYVKQFFQRADMFLLGVCLVSALFGTTMVFRAATGMVASGAELDPTKLVVVQLFSLRNAHGVEDGEHPPGR